MNNLIGKGAEADIFLDSGIVNKIRPPKRYRLDEIDVELRSKRTRSESKILQKIGEIGPGFLSSNNFDEIKMDFIDGSLVKDVLNQNIKLAKIIGSVVGKLHDLNIVHGDLTTSNMILSSNNVKLIDFGLSFVSDKLEDKAVDLHLFKEAVESKHFEFTIDIWDLFVEGYDATNKDQILKRLEIVESRGRNKLKF